MQIVTHPQLLEDVSLLDPVLNSTSWQTLMAFTRDSARKSSLWSELELMNEMDSSSTAAWPTTDSSGPGDSSHGMDSDEISPEMLEQIAAAEIATGGGGGGGGGGSSSGGSSARVRICPHCTFENTHGGHDCEICGLPL